MKRRENECERHERKCSRVDLLEKRIKELEDKIGILEKHVEIVKTPSYPSVLSCQNYPTASNNPYSLPKLLHINPLVEKTICNCSDAKSEKKDDGKPEA